jgi:glutathione S-transferase
LGAILQYLGRKTGRFYPRDERGRVEVDQLLFWQTAGTGHQPVPRPQAVARARAGACRRRSRDTYSDRRGVEVDMRDPTVRKILFDQRSPTPLVVK